jgi:beta-mannosidase
MNLHSFAQTTVQSLNSDVVYWEFHEFNSTEIMSAQVPGNVHTDLMNSMIIPDPLIGINEREVQWVETKTWVYELNHFAIDSDILEKKEIYLQLNGIDTHAEVILNNVVLGKCNNAFTRYQFDVKKIIQPENNQLTIRFFPVVPIAEEILRNRILPLPGDSVRAVIRKPQYHFGWDWGPRLVTCGITKDINLIGNNGFEIQSSAIETMSVENDTIQVRLHVFYNNTSEKACKLKLAFEDEIIFSDSIPLLFGKHHKFFDLQLPTEVPLWWPNESGDQNLIQFQLTVETEDASYEKEIKTGIRTVKLINEKDNQGESFYFLVNDKRIFMKGANYIPLVMLPEVPDETKYRELLQKCKDAHFNMLRVWGGGIYEHDIFYDLCDEMGILIWQDFMFACSMYPGNSDFLNNVKREAEQNIERITYHPCIALWCGNNENAEGWEKWGWKIGLREKSVAGIQSEYDALFEKLLPETLKKYTIMSYWPSSPRFGRGDAASQHEGDSHYWGLWHDEEPFSVLEKKIPRFMSEFGMQSFPSEDVLYLMSGDLTKPLNDVGYLQHQKHSRGFTLMKTYTERWYPKASKKSLLEFGQLTQRMQAEGMCRGIESQRANERCGGTLYWQLNDVWPAFSWSSIDYLGIEKPFFNALKTSYAPQLLTYKRRADGIEIIWIDDQYESEYIIDVDIKIEEYLPTGTINTMNSKNISKWQIEINQNLQTICFIPWKELRMNHSLLDLRLTLPHYYGEGLTRELVIRKN